MVLPCVFVFIQYLHENGVVHRDLKPENLLYATAAPDAPLKIGWWGYSIPCGIHYDYPKEHPLSPNRLCCAITYRTEIIGGSMPTIPFYSFLLFSILLYRCPILFYSILLFYNDTRQWELPERGRISNVALFHFAADFGLSKIIDDQVTMKTVCGTPGYCGEL